MDVRAARFPAAAGLPVLVLRRLARRGIACEGGERDEGTGRYTEYLDVRFVVVVVVPGRVHGRQVRWACLLIWVSTAPEFPLFQGQASMTNEMA